MNAECGRRNFGATPQNEADIAEFLDGHTNLARFHELSSQHTTNTFPLKDQ